MNYQTRVYFPASTRYRVMITSDIDFASDRQFLFVRADRPEDVKAWLADLRDELDAKLKAIAETEAAWMEERPRR